MQSLTKLLASGIIAALTLTASITASAQSVTLVPSAPTFAPGETGTIDIFVSADTLVNESFAVDVFSSDPGSVAFTGVSVLVPDVLSGLLSSLDDVRWQGTGVDEITAAAVTNARGFSVTEGTGLDPENDGSTPLQLVDQEYDAILDAFLFATITFDALDVGTSVITSDVGQFGIFTDGNSIGGQFSFGGTTVEVIPEPASLALLGAGGLMMMTRRRADA